MTQSYIRSVMIPQRMAELGYSDGEYSVFPLDVTCVAGTPTNVRMDNGDWLWLPSDGTLTPPNKLKVVSDNGAMNVDWFAQCHDHCGNVTFEVIGANEVTKERNTVMVIVASPNVRLKVD
jgi:hypothetical protein